MGQQAKQPIFYFEENFNILGILFRKCKCYVTRYYKYANDLYMGRDVN